MIADHFQGGAREEIALYRSMLRQLRFAAHFVAIAVFLVLMSLALNAQKKSSSSSAPAKPAAPAAKPASGGGAAHGPSTSGGASHGPSTSGASHGPTTSGASHGPTTSGASHGPTTSSPHGGTTTANHGATTSSPHGGATTAGKTTTGTGPTHGSTTATRGTGGAGTAHTTANSRPVPAGSHETHAANGSSVRTRPNGQRSDVHDAKRNMDIHHGLNGSRSVEVRRADGSRLVAERGGHGFVERGYHYHGHDYARRSYYYHGRYYDHYYRGYYYHGYYVNAYAPGFYYGPAYYGWAYNPWPAPIVYAGWGWAGNPWYGYYGAWWTPYPVYAGAAFWLTDYLISQSLADAYTAQAQAAAAAAAAPPPSEAMTPEVKQMISDEVKRQIALENQESQQQVAQQEVDPASSGIARMLSDNQTHVFIAGSNLDVVSTAGQECGISQGDVLEVTSAPADNATAATATVLCSKGGKECPKSTQVSVAFTDLQEMQNHMRETIDQGLGDLQSKQGQGGLPAAPPSAKAPPTQSNFVAAAPPPEQNVAQQIDQQSKEADQAEQEVAQEVAPPMPGAGAPSAASKPAAPVSISQGQTVQEVTNALGQPKNIVDLGTKKIYVYPDMKVTFKADKVTDVQ